MAEEQATTPVITNPAMQQAPAGEQTQQVALAPSSLPGGFYWGVGRRKTAVARVRVKPGQGKILVNGREVNDYFHEPKDREAVIAPLKVTHTECRFDIMVNASGGGFTGQAGAILLGLSRALCDVYEGFEQMLRDAGYMTRDSRMKERKKYGQKGARKRFQFSKR
ncbi:MAG: hypothetical protein BIFFINMI_02202 [Phycisphaerae bacterium]|nr:hypothetical protein [Phycisphaerae bacterium]